MTAQSTLLYRLQVIDLTIAKNRARLAEIETMLGQDARVQAARTALTAAESTLTTWQTRARDLDLEMKSLASKIKATENRLYSGSVSNPKELGDMQSEITSLQKRQSKLEDDNIEALLYIEQEQANVQTAQISLDEALAAFASSQSTLFSEKSRLEVETANYLERRKSAAAEIDPASLTRYESLRPKKRGVAVSLLQNGSCTTCGVEQTSMIVQQVKAGNSLVLCGSCGRILSNTP